MGAWRAWRECRLVFSCALVVVACQPVDAGTGSVPLDFGSVANPGDGTIPVETTTPRILLDDGKSTTTDPCVEIEENAKAIRREHCMLCHEAPSPQGKPLTFIMEDDKLV